jgi:SulP family sulfate permease
VVLSLEACDDLDSTAVEVLGEFAASLQSRRADLLLARVKDRPRQALARAGIAEVVGIGPSVPLFWSVDDAACAAASLAQMASSPDSQ